MSDNDQYRFGEDGDIEPGDDDNSRRTSDTGKPLGKYGTMGGSDIFVMGSMLQKAIRRSDAEDAAYPAWELTRSGYGGFFWNRMAIIAVEEFESTDDTLLLVDTLERLAKERWSMDSWEGIVCAVRAAIACARGVKSREHVNANRVFTAMKNERIAAMEEGREPRYDFPEPGDEIFDQHTSAGSKRGRGFLHFMVHSSRLTNETEIGLEWKEFLMRNVDMAYPDKDWTQDDVTEEDIETALTLVEPGEHDEPEQVNETLGGDL